MYSLTQQHIKLGAAPVSIRIISDTKPFRYLTEITNTSMISLYKKDKISGYWIHPPFSHLDNKNIPVSGDGQR